MSDEWTISELQLPLGFYLGNQRINIPFAHNYFIVRNQNGDIVREYNGFAIGHNGAPLTIGTFGEPLRVVQGARFGDQGINETVLTRASQEEILIRLRALDDGSQAIAESGVTYQVTGRNSNSIASTIAALLGLVEPSEFVGASTPGANNLLLTPKQIIEAQIRAGFDSSGIDNNRCFVAGTLISMADGTKKQIEDISVGDIVKAFPQIDLHQPISERRVSRVFIRWTDIIVDLRGLCCTPGHVFLTNKIGKSAVKHFSTISAILREDSTLFHEDETVIRARTGAVVGSTDDMLIEVFYSMQKNEDMCHKECRIIVRAGIPIPPTVLSDGISSALSATLAQHLSAHGVIILPSGRLRTPDGILHDSCNWPEGSTPFDTHEARNWIVEVGGQPYTPPWIRDLVEEDETQGLRIVGALPTAGGTAALSRTL